jgi:hypothetical protein
MYENCFISLSDVQVIIEESSCISGPVCRSFADAASSSCQDEQQFTVKSVISGTPGTKGLLDITIFRMSEYHT